MRIGTRTVATIFWYVLGLYALMIGVGRVGPAWSGMTWVAKATTGLGLLLLVLLFVLIHLAVRGAISEKARPQTGYTPPSPGGAFPQGATVDTGLWILLVTGASLLALFWSLTPPPWFADVPHVFGNSPSTQEAAVTMFAAAVGSMITTVLGYLEHASYRKDFDTAFVPWYAGRPLMGMLLGLVFYFLLKGGLWAVTPPSEQQALTRLDPTGLAGIGSLVGLFSKNAIEKLREVFNQLFSPAKSANETPTPPTPTPIPTPTPGPRP